MSNRPGRSTPSEESEEKRLEGQVALRLLKRRTLLLTGEINRRSSQRLIA